MAEIVSKAAEKNEEEKCAIEMEIFSLREKLMKATKDNTGILNQIAQLSDQQILLEKKMTAKERKNIVDDEIIMKEEDSEYKRLMALANDQALEIATLKEEIKILSRKEGKFFC